MCCSAAGANNRLRLVNTCADNAGAGAKREAACSRRAQDEGGGINIKILKIESRKREKRVLSHCCTAAPLARQKQRAF